MNKKKLLPIIFSFIFSFYFSLKVVMAHCPLCTVGAVAAAGGAAWLGVDKIVIGLFIGAFAVSMGWWMSNLIKKNHMLKTPVLVSSSFLLTVIPLLSVIEIPPYPLFISYFGDYGSLFNRTYLINLFLVGSIIGGLIVSLTPTISRKITALRNGITMPFQGVILTFSLLIILGVILQLAI